MLLSVPLLSFLFISYNVPLLSLSLIYLVKSTNLDIIHSKLRLKSGKVDLGHKQHLVLVLFLDADQEGT